MSWIIFVAIAILSDTFRIFTDNFISDVYFRDREVASQKFFSAFAKTIAGIVILAITGFSFTNLAPLSIFLFILSGVLASIAEVPYYLALGVDDSVNLGIFIQIAPILFLISGWVLFNEPFSPIQLVAILVILIAPTLIVLTSRKRSRKVKIKALLLAFLYILISVVANLVFVKNNTGEFEITNFIEKIALFIFGTGIMDMAIMYSLPKWRLRYKHVKKSSKNKVLLPLTVSFVAGVIRSFAYRAALVTAPTIALASAASDSIEPIVIFFMGLTLTLIWPKFGREKLDHTTVVVHLIATIVVVIGIGTDDQQPGRVRKKIGRAHV